MTFVVFFCKRYQKAELTLKLESDSALAYFCGFQRPSVGRVQVPPTFPCIYKETSYVALLKPKLTHMPSQGRVTFLSHVPAE